MVITKLTTCALLGVSMTLVSCAIPEPTAAVPPPEVKAEEKTVKPEPVVSEPALPPLPEEDGLRMPDMLDLPSEGEFRATNPALPNPGAGTGAVISRPPTDPPSRVKPEVKDPE